MYISVYLLDCHFGGVDFVLCVPLWTSRKNTKQHKCGKQFEHWEGACFVVQSCLSVRVLNTKL
jgi:hypothetical protein